ncbi:hypothetical protein CIT292_07757 [Citrobacter youngae ATCC 29220]|uniref:Uncharacterized protein n=1 Tax=Citrobacter youngae ATCC 29220 TaxID=500640 RepID=D4BBA8_9ENTR|nr:hypothetical protein CIT292_07757 [Citrobacter youngae ATCC 29220]
MTFTLFSKIARVHLAMCWVKTEWDLKAVVYSQCLKPDMHTFGLATVQMMVEL